MASDLHGPGSFLRIIPARLMYIQREYAQKPIATGIKQIP